MEVKLRYIPDGWTSTTLGNICGLITTGKLDANAMVEDGEFPFFTCAKERYWIDKYAFDCEALLVSGNGENVGYVHRYKGKFNAYQRTYVISEISEDIGFIKLFLDQNLQQRIRTEVNAGNTPYIRMDTLSEMAVVLPCDKAEQYAIAGALGDGDALIGGLERLIAKKRELKQAAMQQLLTGKTRLPGFSGKWEEKRLGEIGKFRGGNGFPTRYQGRPEGDYPFFKVSDMNNQGNAIFMVNSNNWISEAVRKEIGANAFPPHSVVFAKIGAAVFLERKKILSRDSCIDNNMMGFLFNEFESCCAFIHCLFTTIKLATPVSTTALPSLNGNELAELKYFFPELKEQMAIAAVLSDMDAEIEALEERLAKTRALKQGMMQELLTGKTRLTVS